MFEELEACLASASSDPSVLVILLTGQGKHFCSGIDCTTREALLMPLSCFFNGDGRAVLIESCPSASIT